ncbi:tRNA (adenosine(37)-N6)-threonylcarbamoyltransferase complex transferase subunit TsaD [Candidatus Uhrbacteria bacterium]|nr:tRNA (adenosine(37)-N6)-threonylcarbamoyltransferase complex transferase subunit TsaD [Candidatus Uhrbacteria bacterium]
MRILGIETSCDETAAALIHVKGGHFSIEKNIIFSQIDIHHATGGVVPEVAARNHVTTIIPVLQEAVEKNIPNVIAVTAGPGLVTSLLVGVETARTLSYLWKKPLVAVNHIEGHIYANWLEGQQSSGFLSASWRIGMTRSIFPTVVLIVSGGHTELVLMKDHGVYELLGKTRDDAAGEAFDKIAKILGLDYPGGPAIAQAAKKCTHNGSHTDTICLPRPMMDTQNFEFSFSGLKTAVLYLFRDMKKNKKYVPCIATEFQQAVCDVLIAKTVRAAEKYRAHTVLLGGGVAANVSLRTQLKQALARHTPSTLSHCPEPIFCTDNAAMIAIAGYFHAKKRDYTDWKKSEVRAQWEVYE